MRDVAQHVGYGGGRRHCRLFENEARVPMESMRPSVSHVRERRGAVQGGGLGCRAERERLEIDIRTGRVTRSLERILGKAEIRRSGEIGCNAWDMRIQRTCRSRTLRPVSRGSDVSTIRRSQNLGQSK